MKKKIESRICNPGANGNSDEGGEVLIESSSQLISQTILKDLTFDFVLDDASHMLADQVEFIRFFLPKLRENGLLIVEDVLPDEWGGDLSLYKEKAVDYNSVSTLVRELPSASIIDNRKVPRFIEMGGGTYSIVSIAVVVYRKTLNG